MKQKKTIKATLQIKLNIFKQEFGNMKNHLQSGIQEVQGKMDKTVRNKKGH